MSVKTAGVGHFAIPTAPAAGTSVTSGSANAFTATYVQLIASTAAAIYITGIALESAAVRAWTYVIVQLATGGAGSETIIGQYMVAPSTQSTTIFGFRTIFPPIPVPTGTRIAAKTADSVGSLATLITLECINQSNVVDDGIAVGTVTTVTNQLTAAAIATGVWQDAVAGDFTTASSIGKALYISNVAPGASGGHMISGSNAGTTTLGALTVTGATTLTGNMVLSDGLTISSPSTSGRAGLDISGNGTGAGMKLTGGATGIGLNVIGGGTSGDGIKVTTTSGHGLNLAPVGTNMHGLLTTGGNGGTSDGLKAVAGTGGTDIRATNITGTLATVTTATTATNLTNAPTSGDFTATMKTSLNAATPTCTVSGDLSATMKTSVTTACTASTPTAAAVTGAVGSVTAAVTLPSIPANWITAAGITAAALNGKGDWNTTAPDNASVTAIKAQTDKMAFTVANQVDVNVESINAITVNGNGQAATPWGP